MRFPSCARSCTAPRSHRTLCSRSHLVDRLEEIRGPAADAGFGYGGLRQEHAGEPMAGDLQGPRFRLAVPGRGRQRSAPVSDLFRDRDPDRTADACDTTRALLRSPALPPVSVFGRAFLNDLDEIEEPLILVLDDYHNIKEPAVHDLLSAFLTHPPRNMHLILLTRRDPPLPIGRLRGRGQVNEVGISELRFTQAETASFLAKSTDLPMDKTVAADR